MNQSQPTMTIIRKRGVTINPTVKAVEVLSIYDYTPSEIAAAWYDEDDMQKITQRCFKVLQRMEECGGTKNGQKYCTRGLEGHTTLGSISKKKTRTAAFAAVLNEQARQWNENEQVNIQAISYAYRKTSSSSQMWAQVIGNQDRQAADAYLYADEEEDEEVDATRPMRTTTTRTTVSISALKSPVSQKRIRKVESAARQKGIKQKSARAA
ncbi:unnamed protein product [Cylindrotheca closterium]|uniref:Uncharacterized protein n=1 Tax=Cylindrotheca closterium TaxID=2856 RepID=A0AAD2G3H1_9STRA|nr:unnamed protein product [Cylindrotheca closterium]